MQFPQTKVSKMLQNRVFRSYTRPTYLSSYIVTVSPNPTIYNSSCSALSPSESTIAVFTAPAASDTLLLTFPLISDAVSVAFSETFPETSGAVSEAFSVAAAAAEPIPFASDTISSVSFLPS